METLLQVVIIGFMLFLCALCLFAVMVIARDIIMERSARRNGEKQESKAEVSEKQEEVAEPVKAAEEVAATEITVNDEKASEEKTLDENAVTFEAKTQVTIEEKYAMLSSEQKGWFDEICRYAMGKTGVKENKTPAYYDYKIGAFKVIRVAVKRNEVLCEFAFLNPEFDKFTQNSNVKMKQTKSRFSVNEASAVGVAKDGIDLVCQQIAEAKEEKRQLALQKRREKRAAAKNTNA